MKQDGWWLEGVEEPKRRKVMKSRLTWEMIGSIVQIPKPLRSFYAEVMRRKHDDHVASHSHPVNQLFHIISSSVFLYCYFLMFTDLTTAVACSLAALFLRQFGHAVIEPPCHDKEELLLGFTTRSKTVVVGAFLALPLVYLWQGGPELLPRIAEGWFVLMLAVVLGHTALLVYGFGLR